MSNTDMTATGYDYETAQTLRVKGLSYKDISTKLGIPFEGLLKYGKRHGWDSIRTKAVRLVSEAVQNDMASRAIKHVSRIADLADKAIENVIARDLATMDVDALAKLANIANTFDLIGRRAYRLDEEKPGARTLLTVTVNAGNGHDTDKLKLADVIELTDTVNKPDVSQ